MNAHAERFNRTLQEEFIEFHTELLFEDIDAFNDRLLDYLIWFNEFRLHYALGLRSTPWSSSPRSISATCIGGIPPIDRLRLCNYDEECLTSAAFGRSPPCS